MLTYEQLKKRFKVVPTKLLGLPKDKSDVAPGMPVNGDCQDYAKTSKKVLGLKWYQAMQIRCWSPLNRKKFPYLPRHAVLWVFGQGFLDSTDRDLRKSPLPHWPLWPVGTPFIAFVVWQIGIDLGLWWGISIYSLIKPLFT